MAKAGHFPRSRFSFNLPLLVAAALCINGAGLSQTFSLLHSFQYYPHGASPYASLYRDATGNLYGTTNGGGPYDAGVVFKIDSAGNETVLHTFTGGSDGGNPIGGLTADSAGNLYGTTYQGGIAGAGVNKRGAGVVYKIDTSGRFQVLYSFTGGADGSGPTAGVIVDARGNLYGTTYYGGGQPNSLGVVYKLSPSGQETVLYTFKGDNGLGGLDGANPYAGLTADRAGNLYGTTQNGGAGGGNPLADGVVYKLSPSGQETLLFSFGTNGTGPAGGGGVILDAAGNIYATGGRVVFKLDPTGKFTKLADVYQTLFLSGPNRDEAGNLYFVAQPYLQGTWPNGAVLKLDSGGKLSVLYKFEGAGTQAGSTPPVGSGLALSAGVSLDSAGNLYGTSPYAGSAGIVYEIEAGGTVRRLHDFLPASGGTYPWSGLTLDSAGNLYGTTGWGGGPTDAGVVYKLSPSGKETVLYAFKGTRSGGSADGAGPETGVVLDKTGNIYGTTVVGGLANAGVVYKLTPSGQESILHSFTGGADGGGPTGITLDAAGNLYGTTYGGNAGRGVVFKLDTAGDFSVLYSFTGLADGSNPEGVVADLAGNLYGTTHYGGNPGAGVIFKIDSTGTYSVLHAFLAPTDGGLPFTGVTLDAAGNLYGTAGYGPYGWGTVYKLDTAGDFSVLYAFPPVNGLVAPMAGVACDAAGNLYGTLPQGICPGGPVGSCGEVYKIDTSGNETVLYAFTGGADGADPELTPVTLDDAGHLFGVAQGLFFTPVGGGVAFKITLP